ncbi:prepilin peptidase [Lactobacillus terrae]|uniref:prepilin peptidase n=1 Tax=Lactobacillus terrae TaxID=2269374 RepID=UPI0010FEB62D|nr:prepilin peptidase [Lactobacillus terrae]
MADKEFDLNNINPLDIFGDIFEEASMDYICPNCQAKIAAKDLKDKCPNCGTDIEIEKR